MPRQSLIQDWLATVLADHRFQLDYLAGDASFRRYARVRLGEQRYMLMDAPPQKEDCAPFVQIDEFLAAHGVRVPKIVAQDIENGLLLLEDFGDTVLAQVLNSSTVNQYYHQAFKQLIALQQIAPSGAQQVAAIAPYSREKLLQELHLFDEWMLPSLGITIDAQVKNLLDSSYDWIVEHVLKQPQVIVHRDFHSRNLMVLTDDTELGVIDFQDAVIGADSYDLISLVRDAYVTWSDEQVTAWFADFYNLLPSTQKHQRTLEQFCLDCEVMAIQRHFKILGIFVRLNERDGKSGYLADLPRVMNYVRYELPRIPALAELNQWIVNDVLPRFEQKYGVAQA